MWTLALSMQCSDLSGALTNYLLLQSSPRFDACADPPCPGKDTHNHRILLQPLPKSIFARGMSLSETTISVLLATELSEFCSCKWSTFNSCSSPVAQTHRLSPTNSASSKPAHLDKACSGRHEMRMLPSILQANRKGRSPDSPVIAITGLISGLHVLSICTVLSPHYKRFLGDIAFDRRRCISGRRCSHSIFHFIQL